MRRASSVVLAALALALALAAPAAAQKAGARTAIVAAALRQDPLYVSDSMARVATEDAVEDLRAAMDRWDAPLYVVWAPFFNEEPGVGTAENFLAQVRDRLDEPGVYVLVEPDGIGLQAEDYGTVAPAVEPLRAILAMQDDVPYQDGALTRAVYLLDVMRTGERPRRGEAERAEREEEDDSEPAVVAAAAAGGVGVLAGWLGPLAWFLRRRRRAGPPPAPSAGLVAASGGDDVDPARAADAVEGLTARVDAAAQPPEAALDALAAARKVLDDPRRRPIDLVGVLALVRAGEAALDGVADARPCFFDPLHPRAKTSVRYAFGGQAVQIPACRECAARMRHDAPMRPALDDGKPYWERDTIWARTGFGALDADLARDVLAGRR